MPPQDWDQRYRTGNLPWDTGRPDDNLVALVDKGAISPCAALEIGCGTATNVIWLAQQGFSVTGVDLAPTAIDMAREKAEAVGADCTLLVCDFLADAVPGGPFGFVFDRGCLHSFDSPDDRAAFARAVADHLTPQGVWLSLLGSTDDPPRDAGPPRRSAADIAHAVEPHFEILALETTHFNINQPDAPRAWRCLMRRRPPAA